MVSATSRENHLDRANAVDLGRRCCTGLGAIHCLGRQKDSLEWQCGRWWPAMPLQ